MPDARAQDCAGHQCAVAGGHPRADVRARAGKISCAVQCDGQAVSLLRLESADDESVDPADGVARSAQAGFEGDARASEEHTSELQSRQYLVCRLLLEKQKTT